MKRVDEEHWVCGQSKESGVKGGVCMKTRVALTKGKRSVTPNEEEYSEDRIRTY